MSGRPATSIVAHAQVIPGVLILVECIEVRATQEVERATATALRACIQARALAELLEGIPSIPTNRLYLVTVELLRICTRVSGALTDVRKTGSGNGRDQSELMTGISVQLVFHVSQHAAPIQVGHCPVIAVTVTTFALLGLACAAVLTDPEVHAALIVANQLDRDGADLLGKKA